MNFSILLLLLLLLLPYSLIGELVRETNGVEGMTRRCENNTCTYGHILHGFHSFEGNQKWELRTRMGKIEINQISGYEVCDLFAVTYMRPFRYMNDILEGEVNAGWLGIGINEESGPFEFSKKDICLGDDYKTGWTLKDSKIKNYAKSLIYSRGPKFLFNLEHLETKSECFRHVTWYATIARTCNALFHRYDVCDKKWLMIYGMPGKDCVHEVVYEVIFGDHKALIKMDGTEEKTIKLGLGEINLSLRSVISDASPIVGMIEDTTKCTTNCTVAEYADFKEFGTQIEAFLPHTEFSDSCYDGFKPGVQFYHHVSTCESMSRFLNGLGITNRMTDRVIEYELTNRTYDMMEGFNTICGDINDKIREKFNEKLNCQKLEGNVKNNGIGSRIEFDIILFTNASYNVVDDVSVVLPSSQEIGIINCTYYQNDGETRLCYSLHSAGRQKSFKLIDGKNDFLIYHSDVDGIECIRFSYYGTYAVLINNGKRGIKCSVVRQRRISEIGVVIADSEIRNKWFNPDSFFSDLSIMSVIEYVKNHIVEWGLILLGVVLLISACCLYQQVFGILKIVIECWFNCMCGIRHYCDGYYNRYRTRHDATRDCRGVDEVIELNSLRDQPSAPSVITNQDVLDKIKRINELEELRGYIKDGRVTINV